MNYWLIAMCIAITISTANLCVVVYRISKMTKYTVLVCEHFAKALDKRMEEIMEEEDKR